MLGSLKKYSINSVPCNIFVETGTGRGASLKHALAASIFDKIYSIEIHQQSAEEAQKAFNKYPQVKVFNSTSEDGLVKVFELLKPNDRVFFYLDAHFPGEFSNEFAGYTGTELSDLALPLERELALIKEYRKEKRDIIVIDDLRLYEQGPYESGNLAEGFVNISSDKRNIDFVYRLFGDRVISKNFSDEGYLIITPVDLSFDLTRLSLSEKLKTFLFKILN